ncbi:hypothetical protein EV177_010030, partial [Coemansia sp. RSA 1804]
MTLPLLVMVSIVSIRRVVTSILISSSSSSSSGINNTGSTRQNTTEQPEIFLQTLIRGITDTNKPLPVIRIRLPAH